MGQKAWFIDCQELDESSSGNQPETRPALETTRKSPALAFSLSMLIWGGGHIYLRNYRPGLIFMGFMVVFLGGMASLVSIRDPLNWGPPHSVSLILIVSSLFVVALAVWVFNAIDAYRRAARMRPDRFQSVSNGLWPLACSLLFPGGGQFLNGEVRKGTFFLFFGLLRISSFGVLSAGGSLWPLLASHSGRMAFDICFIGALLLFPFSVLVWIVSAYDSFRTSREPGGKRPLRKRLEPSDSGTALRGGTEGVGDDENAPISASTLRGCKSR